MITQSGISSDSRSRHHSATLPKVSKRPKSFGLSEPTGQLLPMASWIDQAYSRALSCGCQNTPGFPHPPGWRFPTPVWWAVGSLRRQARRLESTPDRGSNPDKTAQPFLLAQPVAVFGRLQPTDVVCGTIVRRGNLRLERTVRVFLFCFERVLRTAARSLRRWRLPVYRAEADPRRRQVERIPPPDRPAIV